MENWGSVAGLLVAAIGEGWCFLLNGLSFLAVIAGLLAMRLPPRASVQPEPALRGIKRGGSRLLLRLVRRHRLFQVV